MTKRMFENMIILLSKSIYVENVLRAKSLTSKTIAD